MNTRIYIKKHDNFDIKSAALQKELKSVGFDGFISTYSLYDLFNVKESEIALITSSIISDSVSGNSISEIPKHENIFAIEYLPGQFDIRADATMQCCQLLFGHNDIIVQTATVYGLDHFNESDIPFIKKYLINAIDSREKDLSVLKLHQSKKPSDIQIIDGFINYNNEALQDFLIEKRLSIDINDLICIQHYFREEKRNPTITEIKAIDTYWSDHCRHTTFLTELTDIVFSGDFSTEMESTFELYLKIRTELGRIDKKITLMDLGTILPKYFSSKNLLPEYYNSKENNAATITIDADVNGENEKWLLLFKNETHNHPTEIEPFGGAATCIGGAIRDPLSGRAFVYQAMRISGAGNPLENINNTIPSKLPQQKISKESALGYSSYGNQIGLSTTLVTEIYDEGYKAKRLECGFVIGAVKKTSVKEIDPVEGDVVLLIGGDTGRDGIGGASGSSLQHNESSISTMQSEVQKGNAITERKIQKLFRNQEVVQLIKKCNDFGAGGVCVAIGEIAESIEIDLNNIPLKYEGLDGTEIALSESQERMAVVVSKKDAETFIKYAEIENLKATQVATVTNEGALKMKWNGKEILHLKRSFLDTNGAAKKINVLANVDGLYANNVVSFNKTNFLQVLSSKEVASQKGMVELFDSTVLGNTLLMPFGGKYQLTPSDVSAHFICDNSYTSKTVSIASWGYHPGFTSQNTYLGGMYAVVESISKIVAAGGNYKNIYLSFQEYFEKLGNDPLKWGKPFSALLGAFEAQLNTGAVAIGGKDSMSGTFNEMNVPPTLISFAVTTGKSTGIISSEFKSANNFIYLFQVPVNDKNIPNWNLLKSGWEKIYNGIQSGKIIAAKHVKDGGIASVIAQMCFGNKIGAEIYTEKDLLKLNIGSIVIESKELLENNFQLIGKTNFSANLEFNRVLIPIEEAIASWSKTFENIFPTKTNKSPIVIPDISVPSKKIKNIGFGKPTVFVPVFPGTNCEYETAHSFKKEGANILNKSFNNLNELHIDDSIDAFSKAIEKSQIIVFSGGFSAADEPDGSAKFIVNVLKNEKIKNEIHSFLSNGGLILGICNGFQALIKSGLLPYGEIKNLTSSSPTLTHNTIGRHVSQMVTVKVINDNSPWLQGMINKTYIVPVSHGEGRFYCNESILKELIKNNQIATQYLDENNQPTHVFPFNPNGSLFAVEGLINSNGNIFGRMAHPERVQNGRLKNIPNVAYHNIFKNGVDYFL